MLKFKKVTSSKYLGTDGYLLYRTKNGSFSVVKDGLVTKWGTGFQSVRAAEIFLNAHSYIKASSDCIPLLKEEVDLIYNIYCTKGSSDFGKKWYIKNNFWIQCEKDLTNQIRIKCSDGTAYTSGDQLVSKLDSITSDVFATTLLDKEQLESILAKSTILAKREPASSKRAGLGPNDLMRVRSSNVWAIGYQVRNENPKIGDVYVQFKGKEGGSGDVYKYYDVPSSLYRKMITTPSKGAFVWKYLRTNFLYSKLTGDKRGKLKNAVN